MNYYSFGVTKFSRKVQMRGSTIIHLLYVRSTLRTVSIRLEHSFVFTQIAQAVASPAPEP